MDDVKEIIDLAKKVFLQDGYHNPMVFVKGTGGKVAVEVKNFGDNAYQRELDMLNMGTFVACKSNVGELDLIVIVTEAWMSRDLTMLPSQSPKRIEVLMINFLNVITQEEKATTFRIIRDKWGKAIELRPLDKSSDFVEVKGHLLPAFVKGYRVISPVRN
jgi:hypothetical protein